MPEFTFELFFLNIAGIIGILAYWEIKELLNSKADTKKGQHSTWGRLGMRIILPGFGLLMILQLWGLEILSYSQWTDSWYRYIEIFAQGIFWLGILYGIWARESIGDNWAHAAEYQVIPGQKLTKNGPYAYIRHPIYSAFLLIFFITQILVGSFLVVLIIPLFWVMDRQCRQEEKILIETFGEEYTEYMKTTRRLI